MAPRLTEAEMLRLAQIYKTQECLWNTGHSLYKNRSARSNAYKDILEMLDIPGVTIPDIPNKIKNLRTSYYQELRKIDRSFQSGADPVYRPKVAWFTTADGFLKAFRDTEYSFSAIDEYSNASVSDASEVEMLQESANGETHIKSEETSDPLYNFVEDSPELNIRNKCSEPGPSQAPPPQNQTNTTKNDNLSATIARINKIANSLSRTENSLRKSDEFDCFGKYIAETLRSLPPQTAIVAKTEIQKTLEEIQLRVLKPSYTQK